MTDGSGQGIVDDEGGRAADWRSRYDADRDRGVALDPRSDPVPGVRAYPTDYAPDRLLVTRGELLDDLYPAIEEAASDFGWVVTLNTLDDDETETEVALDRARRARDEWDLPTIYRVRIVVDIAKLRLGVPVPPVDAWRLLQRLRARSVAESFGDVQGVSLEHVLSVDPFGGKTNPFGGKTNPFQGKTNANAPGMASYGHSGTGGRQVLAYVGVPPARALTVRKKGRRPVVAVFDTGCGVHAWLGDDVVERYPVVDGVVIGLSDRATDPETHPDLSGPFEGEIDPSAGHGTFVAGIVRQLAPEADIVAVRVADGDGTVLEGTFLLAVRNLVKAMSMPAKDGGRRIDVLNLSLGYYHETPDDEQFDRTLVDLLVKARHLGCAVVCSSGNDATDRPAFPAALWRWPGADFVVDDPADAAPHVSVGALNPNGTMALFSNLGAWVSVFAPGAAVLSTHPAFRGGVQSGSRDDRDGWRRETIAPEDFRGGFALWSGTSFAAPYVAGMIAQAVAAEFTDADPSLDRRIELLQSAAADAITTLKARGPRRGTGGD